MRNLKRGFDWLPVIVTVAVNFCVMMKTPNLNELSQFVVLGGTLVLISNYPPLKALPLIAQVLIGFS